MRGKGINQQTLSETELQSLKEERKDIQDTLKTIDGKGTEQYGQGTPAQGVDRVALERQDKRLRDAIEAGSPQKFRSGAEKDKAYHEARELEEKIKTGMCSRAEMNDMRRHPGADRKHLAWEKANSGNIARWKQLQRQLNPGDPTCSSVENFRRD